MSRLTTQAYWENFYADQATEKRSILAVCSKYDEWFDQAVAAAEIELGSVLEVGCYPGRYLAYIASRYGLQPTGIDFNSDRTKIDLCMKTMGVEHYDLIQGDFFQYQPEKTFDLVFSNGFIEHFDNFDQVLDLHAPLITPGGALIVLIPNKTWGQWFYRYFFDIDNLRAHNTKCMNFHTFKSFGQRNGLRLERLDYWGPFTTNPHKPLGPVRAIMHRPVRKGFSLMKPFIERHPSRLWSSVIGAIFIRPKAS